MDEFDEICRRCTPVVYRFLLSLCKDASLADELTAETFYQAYLHIDTFRGNCRVESWLCQIAKNALTKELRRQRRAVPFEETHELAAPDDIFELLADKEQAMRIHASLHRLKEPYREVFTLRVLGDHIGRTYTFAPDGKTLLDGVARDYLLWLLRRELTPPDSMLDFFRSDTPLTDRILSDRPGDLTDCALAGVECVLEAYAYPRGEIYDLKLLLPELAMRLAEDEDTPELEHAHALCASLGSEHFFTQLAPLTPRYDARDIFLATLTLYLREQTA